jgi:hypothetical protein
VLDPSGFADEAPPAGGGVPIPPTTVRDPGIELGAPAYPYSPAPPYASPYAAPPAVGIPPPPTRARGRVRGQGPSLLLIGVISFFVIGGGVTAVVLVRNDAADDKPAPSVDVPAPANVPPDPGAAGAPTDQPAAADPPPPPVPVRRPTYPGKTNPGLRPGTRPGQLPPRPGPTNPRYPGPRRPTY